MTATSTQARRGRKPKPAAIRRSETIRIRVTPGEKAMAQGKAELAGLGLSDWARLQICGSAPEQTVARIGEMQRQRKVERVAPGDRQAIEERIHREQPGLPRLSVRTLATREMQRG